MKNFIYKSFQKFSRNSGFLANLLDFFSREASIKFKGSDFRHFKVLYCLELTKDIPGSILELGVGSGFSLVYINSYLKRTKSEKIYYGCDTFEGFPDVDDCDKMNLSTSRLKVVRKGHYSDYTKSIAERKLKNIGYKYSQLRKGIFSQTLPHLDGPFSFIFLDCDLYQGYLDALTNTYEKLSPGGIILFDEYHETDKWPGAKLAVDEFFADKREKPQKLPFAPDYYVVKL